MTVFSFFKFLVYTLIGGVIINTIRDALEIQPSYSLCLYTVISIMIGIWLGYWLERQYE